LVIYIKAGRRKSLTDYTMHSLSPCYGLLTAFVLLKSVARWWNSTQSLQKWGNFACLYAWTSKRIFL